MLTVRSYQSEDDFWRIRDFLRRLYLENGRLEHSWQPYRFDYWRWHGIVNLSHGSLETHVFLWETPSGELAAVLNGEAPGNAFLQVDPAFETPRLIDKMIAKAEGHLFQDTDSGQKLNFWINDKHIMRQELLRSRGYGTGKWAGYERRRPLIDAVPDVPIPDGYIVRALGDIDELPSRSWASWKSFHPNEPDEDYKGWDWYLNLQRCPLYRRDLDMVAITPNGEVAAFCTVWFDDETRTGSFEPVGTHVDHWRKGLGKAVMTEGLRRLQRIGADLACVCSFEDPAHRLYASMGFTEYEVSRQWERASE